MNRCAVLAARSLRVLVVSFGSLEGAQIWLEQTGCAFDIVLDPQRKIYRTFGLGSSYADVLRFDCLLQYSEYEAEAGSSRAPWVVEPLDNNVLIFQMGGDFLLDEAGTVLFSHRCRTPLDRPSVQDVLQAADVRV
uniref:Alkyl hydroperoxide reductase subunit C/ Thiol specific antioxidant domain-containing protein n=1 Tax=Takifugu rubripes TaxID=31033 RepID=A0A674N9E3_TAKRU